MALRAFHANPSIGGFGDENTATLLLGDPQDGTFPTNDNTTVSEANGTQGGGDALCQIIKELVDNAVDACETARKEHDMVSYRVRVEISPYNGSADVLQVTVSDNGCGMEDIQKCVEAFQSSKDAGNDETAGRYGLGLTLSMVHSQRLVPGRVFCCITSATRQAPTFRRQHYLVDTIEDRMRCARDETVLKVAAEVSGTCVSLLVPVSTPSCALTKTMSNSMGHFLLKRTVSIQQQGGATASRAWNRIVIYLKRFHLSPTRCSIEVLAPTLATLPILVRCRVDPSPDGCLTSSQDSSESFQEGFDSHNDDTPSDDHQNVAVIKVQNAFLQERTALQQAAQMYGNFDLPLNLCNIAHAENIIRQLGQTSGDPGSSNITSLDTSPKITVDFVVSPQEETENVIDGDESDCCFLELVRMVNSVPLLDSVESIGCGLVRAMKSSVIWSSFGLTVLGGTESNEDTWINRFKVRDSDQVAPFFQQSNHKLWDAKGDAVKQGSAGELQEKKRKRKSSKLMLPAKVRLGKILVIVNIQAAPNVIPMPTLTKGRLPVNHEPITKAFHLGIRDCLRNLQITSPGLLLNSVQLRSVERDVRYVPLVARASANLLSRLQNQSNRSRALQLLKQIRVDDEPRVHGSRFPLGHDDVVRIIERKSRAAVLRAETAKTRHKRKRCAEKDNGNETDGYEEIEELENSGNAGSTKQSSQDMANISPCDEPTFSEGSSDLNNLCQGSLTQNELIVGGVEIHDYDDDDEWW
jgi:anti-sigma regulatory factor (Ser/Thr protein kinase)